MDNYVIDWNATGAMFAGIGSLIAAGVLIATFIKARKSFEEWKRQEAYKTDRKLAIDILAAFEEGKQAIRTIRSIVSLGEEQAEVERFIKENSNGDYNSSYSYVAGERDRLKKRITVQLRIQHHKETWDRIIKILPVAKAIFGVRIKNLLVDVLKARQEIWIAASMFHHKLAPTSEEKYDAIIWLMTSKPEEDAIESKLQKAEKELEQKLTPYIRSDNQFNAEDEYDEIFL